MANPICQKLVKELEGKPKVRLLCWTGLKCVCQGLNVITEGETYHYCYPELDTEDPRYK